MTDEKPKPVYSRSILLEVLIYHQRRNITYCSCGWSELGKSHPEHVIAVYEESVLARLEN